MTPVAQGVKEPGMQVIRHLHHSDGTVVDMDTGAKLFSSHTEPVGHGNSYMCEESEEEWDD